MQDMKLTGAKNCLSLLFIQPALSLLNLAGFPEAGGGISKSESVHEEDWIRGVPNSR
jgi:hypothetical protein